MKAFLCALAATLAAAPTIPAHASAQQERIYRPPGGNVEADLILYRQPNYNGPSVRVQAPVPDLGLSWRIRSVRVVAGEWQLCARTNFEGCIVVRDNIPVTSALTSMERVRSARPVTTSGPSVEGEAGPHLRGMAAEFFTHPASNRRRILACSSGSASADCARETAQRFCRGQGYNYAVSVAMQTVSGRVYLADVLCKRSAG